MERAADRHRLEREGQRLVERLGGRWSASGGLCRCPAHDDRSPSLSVRPGRSRLLLHCFAGCEVAAILAALEGAGLLVPEPGCETAPAPRDAAGTASLARRLWDESLAIAGTPAQAYLVARGIDCGSPELRFHPRAPIGGRPRTEYRPALIAAVRDSAGLVAVHRTFLDGDGRSGCASARLGLGRFGTGAVRLGGPAVRLGLAEGIETALSATALFGLPCWATLGAERFGRIALPPDVRELVLFLDHDRGGQRAARLARETFAALDAIAIQVPDRPGADWNDVLRSPSS